MEGVTQDICVEKIGERRERRGEKRESRLSGRRSARGVCVTRGKNRVESRRELRVEMWRMSEMGFKCE